MAAAGTKIKVSRELLLERLQEVELENQENYLNALDVYGDEMEVFRDELGSALRKLAVLVESPFSLEVDNIDNEYRGGVRLGLPDLHKPTPPTQPGPGLGKMIRTLELSTETTIMVSSTDDYARYI